MGQQREGGRGVWRKKTSRRSRMGKRRRSIPVHSPYNHGSPLQHMLDQELEEEA